MAHQPKSVTVHRHYHYHYHYDVEGNQDGENCQRYSSPSTMTPQHSYISPSKSSWRNHINPQVTKMYQQISLHESFDDTYTPKASRQRQRHPGHYSNTASQIQPKTTLRPRNQLLQNIQTYQQYLKKHSQPNLFIPSTPSLKRYEQPMYRPSDHKRPRFVSLNQLYANKRGRSPNLDDILATRAESKIMASKRCQSTTVQENDNLRDSQMGTEKNISSQKTVRQSQIKGPFRTEIFDRARIRMSVIEQPSSRPQELQNSNFSLFQRETKQESMKSSSNGSRGQVQVPQQVQQQVQAPAQQTMQDLKSSYNYKLQLIKEQCNFLRNKFIQHAQSHHKINF